MRSTVTVNDADVCRPRNERGGEFMRELEDAVRNCLTLDYTPLEIIRAVNGVILKILLDNFEEYYDQRRRMRKTRKGGINER
jgi:hypothetical protein